MGSRVWRVRSADHAGIIPCLLRCDYRDSSQGSPSCDDLPPLPQEPGMMNKDGDNLVDLCKYILNAKQTK